MPHLITRLSSTLTAWLSSRDERGASLVEYTLLVAFIAMACFAAIGFVGDSNEDSINTSADSIVVAAN